MNGDQIYAEMEKEIDKMSLEELLYVRMAPQNFINKKFQNKIDESNELIKEIESNYKNVRNNEEEVKKQNAILLKESDELKKEIEQTKNRINELILKKKSLSRQPTKDEFIKQLDIEIKKNFSTPDSIFKDFLAKNITENDLLEKLKELGTGKNYYYYKILSDKLKEI